jgi:D-sedoheptulose 7-phosphate isomerase
LIIDAHPAHVVWYGQASLLTFNAEESLEAAKRMGLRTDSVEKAGVHLSEKLDSGILVTQGGEGMSLFPRRQTPSRILANRVPIADRAGAGDSVTAVLALGLAAGAELRQAAELANKAAGIVVTKPGIAYVRPEELVNLFHEEISQLLRESAEVKQRLIREQLPAIESVVRAIIRTYRESKTVYAFGNGGSAADANHFITELVGRFMVERKALPAVSFSSNEILMTSIANDYGYENTFARQVEAFVKPGDLVAAFSTSGKSKNVLKALELARSRGATTVGFTGGAASDLPGLCDVCIRVPSQVTPRIQESHVVVVHIICELLEKELALPEPKFV